VYLTAVEDVRDIGRFALITAVDVLEHSADPGAFMEKLAAMLEDDGILYVQTPSHSSVIYQIGRRLCNVTGGRPRSVFERLFPCQHTQYLSHDGLLRLADRCGLRMRKIETQTAPADELAVSGPVKAGLMTMQMVDRVRGSKLLTCAVLQRRW
jgi:hypothetical protein